MTNRHGDEIKPTVLTDFQVEVARLFFSLAASDRFLLAGGAALLVDIALDSPPRQPATASFLGPTFAPDELAGRKLLALFDRAEARDFADVYVLLQTYTKNEMLTWAHDMDGGFDPGVLAEQFGTLSRFLDSDLPVESASAKQMREFFDVWRHELTP